MEEDLLFFPKTKENYTLTFDNQTYQLTNKLAKRDETVLRYSASLVKMDKSKIKAHFFDKKDPISISEICFHSTFKLS